MPKEVDHAARRRELADAACRVIARNGLEATTLADLIPIAPTDLVAITPTDLIPTTPKKAVAA